MNSHAVEVAFFASVSWIAWAAAYAWSRWLIRPHREPEADALAHANRVEERLASIEQTMQAMAIEIERLGEGQRFTTKLLTERAAQSLIAPPDRDGYRRVDTPH
jgi:hypothetical protein